ncbi:hypothetical protein EDI28_05480 [Photobacterium chitinilyticum]|uniref:Uncharacterized protein n=1 Tax=Photobacterium chitinilyticum TaxID=2485123 RepID=A0A444JWJ9_9GAMM|nr:hypothetical protein EDI28_05480 [Photobacterium chitinilyticum]
MADCNLFMSLISATARMIQLFDQTRTKLQKIEHFWFFVVFNYEHVTHRLRINIQYHQNGFDEKT